MFDEREVCGFWVRSEARPCGLPRRNHLVRKSKKKRPKIIMGLDCEGVGRDPHRLVMFCAADHRPKKKGLGPRDPHPRRRFIEREEGLSTEECLQFILSLPRGARLFAFGFAGYDLTKILADLPDEVLYALNNPKLRTAPPSADNPYPKPDPVPWVGPSGERYLLNLIQTRFSVFVWRERKLEDGGVKRYRKRRTIWDIVRFWGTSFVDTLEDWSIGSPKKLESIRAMKKRRGQHDWTWDARDEIRRYCLDECHLLALLAKKNIEVHAEAGIPLKSFYGAGSSAGAMLKRMKVMDFVQLDPTRKALRPSADDLPRTEFEKHLTLCIMRAFFGGHFENAITGAMRGPIYNCDISSAYAYQLTFLPCLLHGGWSRTRDRKRVDAAKAALVCYALGDAPKDLAWGPLPFREVDGSIIYPAESGGGWVWRAEFLAAERLAPHVHFIEAYVLESDCDCRPFAEIPAFYRLRLEMGKEGAGLGIKTALAAGYGKLSQTVGSHPFQCFVWAGMTTSGTRAQLLDVIGLHKDKRNVLALATDGLLSREQIVLPAPRRTGTENCKRSRAEIEADRAAGVKCPKCGTVGCELAHKPLGGWETKVARSGVFFAGLGRYWDLDKHGAELDASLKSIRARGIGRRTLAAHVGAIRAAWAAQEPFCVIPGRGPTPDEDLVRFRGMKSNVRRHPQGTYSRTATYGEWVPTDIRVSFDPRPKRTWPTGELRTAPRVRDAVNDYVRLELRKMPRSAISAPYLPNVLSEEALQLKAARDLQSEQPDPEDKEEFEDT